jgi:DNA-binding CsgD family transcriptional regulator
MSVYTNTACCDASRSTGPGHESGRPRPSRRAHLSMSLPNGAAGALLRGGRSVTPPRTQARSEIRLQDTCGLDPLGPGKRYSQRLQRGATSGQSAMRAVDAYRLEKACKTLSDTVLDPAVWPQAMESISRAVGATGAALLQSDVRTPDIPRTASVDEAFTAYFRNGWHVRDVRADRGVPLLLGGASVITDQDLLTREEMLRNPMYNEHCRHFGLQWFAAVRFWAGSALWGLTIQRKSQEGPFEADDKQMLATLSQELTEVATLSTAIGRIALSSATNALSAVCYPAIAIDRFGFVLDANPATQAVFDDDVYTSNRRLFLGNAQAKSCFQKLIDKLRITPDTAAVPFDPIVIRREGRPPIIVRVLPVPGAARTPFLGARALLTFTTLERKTGPTAALLSKAFDLTPAEAKLAAIIAEGMNPERAAEELGISRETARNQLKAVFAKTDTHRQSELVALLSRL